MFEEASTQGAVSWAAPGVSPRSYLRPNVASIHHSTISTIKNLGFNSIRAEAAGGDAPAVPVARPPRLLVGNIIRAESAGQLAVALGQCTSSSPANLNLRNNRIGAKGSLGGESAGPDSAAPACTSLAHLDLDSNFQGGEDLMVVVVLKEEEKI